MKEQKATAKNLYYSPNLLIRSVEISYSAGWLYQKTKGTL